MTSIHESKELFLIIVLLITIFYMLFKGFKENFRKKYLYLYNYSIPFIIGSILMGISVIGFVYSFYYTIGTGKYFFASILIGLCVFCYGRSNVAKYEGNHKLYKIRINNVKRMSFYTILVVLLILLREFL